MIDIRTAWFEECGGPPPGNKRKFHCSLRLGMQLSTQNSHLAPWLLKFSSVFESFTEEEFLHRPPVLSSVYSL